VITPTIDMSAGDIYGIYADCCKKCIFENNYVYGFVDDGNKYGILLTQNSQYNKIRDNKVIGSFNPKNRQFLIMLMGNALPYGNYFDGAGKFARATKPTVANIVSDNFCQYGTHGIVVNAGERDTINNNRLEGQSHRSIALEPACWYDVVTSNTCLEYGSSAVVCGYGCAYNVVAKNICRAGTSKFPLGGEASINFVVGNEGNRIQGNIIDAPKNYGI